MSAADGEGWLYGFFLDPEDPDKRIPESEMPPESHETYIDSAKKNR